MFTFTSIILFFFRFWFTLHRLNKLKLNYIDFPFRLTLVMKDIMIKHKYQETLKTIFTYNRQRAKPTESHPPIHCTVAT